MDIHIKNMVCPRCVTAVKNALSEAGIGWEKVDLGIVQTSEPPAEIQLDVLDEKLEKLGFERIQNPAQQLITHIKKLLITYLNALEEESELPVRSDYLSGHLHKNYSYLSDLFSKTEGRSIEQHWIALKTERARELLESQDLSVTEIAHRLGYSSSQYFANQFRRRTGMTPSSWKKQHKLRKGRQAF